MSLLWTSSLPRRSTVAHTTWKKKHNIIEGGKLVVIVEVTVVVKMYQWVTVSVAVEMVGLAPGGGWVSGGDGGRGVGGWY
jgi:hypothetical protein